MEMIINTLVVWTVVNTICIAALVIKVVTLERKLIKIVLIL